MLKTHSTLISRANKEYELRMGNIMTHKSTSSLKIKFWNWHNILL